MTLKTFKELMKNEDIRNKMTANRNDFPLSFLKYIVSKFSEIEKVTKIKDLDVLNDIFSVSHLSGHSISTTYDKFVIHNSLDKSKGRKDGGIDGFFLMDSTLYLVQTKLDKVKEEHLTLMKNTFRTYIQGNTELGENQKSLHIFKEFYITNQEKIKDVKYIGVAPFANGGQHFTDKFIYKSWKDIMSEAVANINKQLKLTVEEYSKSATDHEESMVNKPTLLIKINGKEFIDQLKMYNSTSIEAVFEQNVRDEIYKSNFRESFKETILKEPDKFEVYNNGLTVISEKVNKNVGDKLELINPQIINGQQTTRTLLELSSKGIDISGINLYIKIIETNDDNLIMKIAKNSNSQSSIKEGDLISSTKEFKEISTTAFKSGFYINAKDGDSEKKRFFKTIQHKSINITELIKMHIAINDISMLPKAKVAIGEVKQIYIRNKTLSKIEQSDLKKIYKLIEKKKHFVSIMKQRNLQSYAADEAKERNALYTHADLAIMRFVVKNKEVDEIFQILQDFYNTYSGKGMINEFKIENGYRSLGIDIPFKKE